MGYEIGSRIRKYREIQNLSQKDFAEILGVSNSRVSNWEQGVNRPDVDFLSVICTALKISPNELLNFRLSSDDLNWIERAVITQYRRKPQLQQAVNILLGLDLDNDGGVRQPF